MGLAISLMMNNYLEYKEQVLEMTKTTNLNYIELSSIKLDKNVKQIIFNNNING